MNAKGRVELPLKAGQDRWITKAKVRFGINAPERLSGSLQVIDKRGKKQLISDSLSAISEGGPVELLGSEVLIRLEVINQSRNPTIVLSSCKV